MIRCDALKYAYRQSKDGFVISFVVHPQDMDAALALLNIGTPGVLTFSPLDDDGNPSDTDTDGSPNQQCSGLQSCEPSARGGEAKSGVAAPSRPSHRVEACMACNEPSFQEFLKANNMLRKDLLPEVAARDAIYFVCGVSSRRDLYVDSPAGAKWRGLYQQWMEWPGK